MLAGLLSCESVSPVQQVSWASPELRDHPLVGVIWESASARTVSREELIDRMQRARYVLIGEKHDNADHHRLQRDLLEALIESGGLGSVSFEMMESATQPSLDAIAGNPPGSLAGLKQRLEWDDEGWNWDYYGPLIHSAVLAGLPTHAANIDAAAVGAIYAGNAPEQLPDVTDAQTRERLNRDIDESHCGMLPESQFPAMVRVQQHRDASMARNMLRERERGTALLFAGNYHVRKDLGVPLMLSGYDASLQSANPDALVSLAILEVVDGEFDPADYEDRFGAIAPYDYIWFTPSLGEIDYCASMMQSNG